MKNRTKIVVAVALVAIIGFGVNAFADWGRGYGMQGRGYQGYGQQRGYGPCVRSNLSNEEIQQLEQAREAFLNDTEGLRNDIYAKRLALRAELAKESPDPQRAAELQKELSSLEAQLDQKRVDHMISMRKINPNAGRGFYHGRGMRGYRGSGQGGYCWR